MEKIISINLEEEIKASYVCYCDGKDGLKPVQRRVLYGMYEQGAFNKKNYRKSARIVGDVLGKYHHEAIVRMAQSWSLRYPLIDGQGPAAMRYTEIKLQKVSEEMLFVENLILIIATNMPPHNIVESINAICSYIENTDISILIFLQVEL